jgi:hypothetical protein
MAGGIGNGAPATRNFKASLQDFQTMPMGCGQHALLLLTTHLRGGMTFNRR